MRVLVTGGAGFIGHHLVASLLARGDEVAVIDDFSTGLRSRLVPFEGRIHFVEGSICDPAALDRAIEGCAVVLHQAALPSVARSVADPRLSNEVNTNGTIEVMRAAGRAGVRRVVTAGSSSVYGIAPGFPRVETQKPDPRSPYAVSKLAAEQYTHSLGALLGIETVVLRYFNVFGPAQDPNSQYAAVIPLFITAGLEGRPVTVHGDGTQSRDFTFIENVVSANLLAATTPGVTWLTCNVGCGDSYSLLDLLDLVERELGHPLTRTFGPSRPGDVPYSQADIGEAATHLGYRVLVSFAEGIRRTVDWYREQAALQPGSEPAGDNVAVLSPS